MAGELFNPFLFSPFALFPLFLFSFYPTKRGKFFFRVGEVFSVISYQLSFYRSNSEKKHFLKHPAEKVRGEHLHFVELQKKSPLKRFTPCVGKKFMVQFNHWESFVPTHDFLFNQETSPDQLSVLRIEK
ncbi:hypothetical protein [Dapis sp. BLCC M172]|uniref:hypothetical protein n=1 Tax=Dapis sp. BLCC M172 TaxID=2975281 RepID=UPI003CFB9E74